MDYKSRFVIAYVVVATVFVAGCAVEVPKSSLADFRLSPPQEPTNANR
jgi:outer membrane murein-binding lipoprotein Lpp